MPAITTLIDALGEPDPVTKEYPVCDLAQITQAAAPLRLTDHALQLELDALERQGLIERAIINNRLCYHRLLVPAGIRFGTSFPSP